MEKPSDDWTDQETEILVDEIILRQDVIHGSDSSIVTDSLRQQAWEEVMTVISSKFPQATPKTLDDARNKWIGTLCEVKDAVHLYKHSVGGTEACPPFILKPLHLKILLKHYGMKNPLSKDEIPANAESDVKLAFQEVIESLKVEDIENQENSEEHFAVIDGIENLEELEEPLVIINEIESQENLDEYLAGVDKIYNQRTMENYLKVQSKRLMNERFDLLLSIMKVRAKINLPQLDVSEYPEDMRNYLTNLKDHP